MYRSVGAERNECQRREAVHSLGDVACGVQRSVELPVRVIKSRSVPTDACRHAVCWSNLCLSNLSRHRQIQ